MDVRALALGDHDHREPDSQLPGEEGEQTGPTPLLRDSFSESKMMVTPTVGLAGESGTAPRETGAPALERKRRQERKPHPMRRRPTSSVQLEHVGQRDVRVSRSRLCSMSLFLCLGARSSPR